MTYYFVLPLPKSIIRAKTRAGIIEFSVLDLENELLQCEFTNELRNYREDIQIVCNHIAVENPTCFLCSRTLIQSYFRILSKRLSCFISNTYSVLLAIGFTDFVFDRWDKNKSNNNSGLYFTYQQISNFVGYKYSWTCWRNLFWLRYRWRKG